MLDLNDCSLVLADVPECLRDHPDAAAGALNAHGFEVLAVLDEHRAVLALDFTALTGGTMRRSYASGTFLTGSIRRALAQLAPQCVVLSSGLSLNEISPEAVDTLLNRAGRGVRAHVQQRFDETLASIVSPYPVLDTLAHGERSVVRLVDHPLHGAAVLKMFRPGARAAAQREIAALTALSAESFVVRMLDHGASWILTEYVIDSRQHVLRPLPGVEEDQMQAWVPAELVRIVSRLRSCRLWVADLTSHNVMSTDDGTLKLFDLEFAYTVRADEFPALDADPSLYGRLPAGLVPAEELFMLDTNVKWWNRVQLTIFHAAITGTSRRRLLTTGRRSRSAWLVQVMWLFFYTCLDFARRARHAVARRSSAGERTLRTAAP